MKTLAVLLGLVALASREVPGTAPDANELKVKVSGMSWPNGWGKTVMSGLKRLSGAKDASQDDYVKGVGTYIVTFAAPPKVKLADVKKELPKYKIEGLSLKITTVVEGNKVGDLTLANPKDEDLLKQVADLKGKKLVLSGALTEDDKGAQTLTLSKVAEAPQ